MLDDIQYKETIDIFMQIYTGPNRMNNVINFVSSVCMMDDRGPEGKPLFQDNRIVYGQLLAEMMNIALKAEENDKQAIMCVFQTFTHLSMALDVPCFINPDTINEYAPEFMPTFIAMRNPPPVLGGGDFE